MNLIIPTTYLTLTAAQVWLALQELGVVSSNLPLDGSVEPSGELLNLTEKVNRSNVSQLSISNIIRTTAFPDRVCIITIRTARNEESAQTLCCSYAAQHFIVSWVDSTNVHHFHEYALENVAAAVWQHLRNFCDLDIDGDHTNVGAERAALEHAMQRARQTVLLILIKDVQSAEQRSSALSWFVSDRSAWLIEQQKDQRLPQQIGPSSLSNVVQTFVDEMIR